MRIANVRASYSAVFALAVVAGCGGDEPLAPPPDPPRAEAISISPQSVVLTTIGEIATVTASLTDQFGQPFTGTIAWSSSTTDVFTVDEDGMVTAVANGSGTVTAAHEGLSATASVTVDAPENLPPLAIGTPGDIDLAVGGGPMPFLPAAYFDDPGGHNPDLTYTTVLSDSAVASAVVTVDSERHVSIAVTGSAAGTTRLTVRATDPGGLWAEQSLSLNVDESGHTPLPPIRIADNKLEVGAFSIVGACSPPIRNQPLFAGGPTFSVNSSRWQTRSDADAAWTDVEGSEATTGVLCSYTSRTAGEYRLIIDATIVVDEHQDPITGGYRSANSFVVEEGGGENEAPTVNEDAPRNFRLSVGGGPFLLTVAALFTDPDGDDLTFTAAVSDTVVLTAEVLVDNAGHTLLIARAAGPGSGTLTVTATDPGGLTADLAMEVSVDDTGYTPYNTIEVANGVIRTFGTDFSVCLGPLNNTRGIDGNVYTVHSSRWQTRNDASVAWTEVEGTEVTDGRICPHSTEEPGDYRLVYEVTIVVDPDVSGFRGKYASSNFFTVSGGG